MAEQHFYRQLPGESLDTTPPSLLSRLHLDPPLLITLLLLSGFGLWVLYSAANADMAVTNKQSIRIGIGLGALVLLAQVPPRVLRFWTPIIYAGGLILLLLVLVAGTEIKGAQRWLSIPGLGRFQPAELLKLAAPAMVAWYFHERHLPARLKDVFIALSIVALPSLLIALQPDLGTALLVAAGGLIALFIAGLSWRLILLTASLIAVAAPLAYYFVLHDYQRRRVDTFINPEADPLGAGWNIIQSKTAIGSGGLTGKGWFEGTQSRLDFLPESSTDFIFAVLGEEFGFLGFLVLLACYLTIVLRSLLISYQAQDTFGRLLSASIGLTFFVYVIVNIGMVTGLLPVVGVPLPLVSYGGTSIITLLAGFGVLMSIHTHRKLHIHSR
ncbi:MAG TPA: rod shape-determining protein RodA [Alcanivoracaceae bacterium]|nr:rod shape-determining protein RodA [Alcanivoracaceae bacterium]